MNSIFQVQMLQTPCPKEYDDRAEAAAKDYDEQCELYDRAVCGEDGRPKNATQRSLISAHASVVRGFIIKEYRITEDDFRMALRDLRMRRSRYASRMGTSDAGSGT